MEDAPAKKRALISNKTSSEISLSTIIENPLNDSSASLDYPLDNLTLSQTPTNESHKSNGTTSPPPFYTKRPVRKLPKISRLKFLPKQKPYNTITIDNSKPLASSMSPPSLPHYSTVNQKPDTHPLNSTTLDNHDNNSCQIFSSTSSTSYQVTTTLLFSLEKSTELSTLL